ncbi:CHAT domain-containing protein [Streptomyces cyaneofuscatus]|uniref:CHAT domain-containing protein n=1 Tax=Streptomyces cyaneofuscatus TaxID=66883 RepID=UPI003329D4A5
MTVTVPEPDDYDESDRCHGADGCDGPDRRSLDELVNAYARTRDLDALRHLVHALRRAVVATDARDTRPFQLIGALQELFARTGEIALLMEAVETGREARGRDAAAGRPSKTALLSNLGSVLEELHWHRGGTHLLTEAVEVNREAVRGSDPGARSLPGRMANLCNSLHALYREDVRERGTLDEAVAVGRGAEALTRNQRGPLRAIVTGNLQNALVSLFTRTDDDGLVDETASMGVATIAAFAADDPRRAVALSNHAEALRTLAARTGDRALMDASLTTAREAVRAAGDHHPDRALCLSSLAASLRLLYTETGDEAHLEEYLGHTLTVAREASDGPGAAPAHAELSLALRLRHDRDGDLQSLLWAVEAGRRALAATEEGQAHRVTAMNRLVNALHVLFAREQDPAHLAEAVALARLAVTSCPPDHPHHAGNLYDLARLLLETARSGQDPAAAHEAVDICRSAVATLDEDDPDRAAALLILSQSLCEAGPEEEAVRPGGVPHLEEAVASARSAVAMVPAGSTLTSAAVRTLGQALLALGTAHPDPSRGRAALMEAHDELMRRVAVRQEARAKDRVAAARLAGRAAYLAGNYADALAAFERAVELLPRIAPRELLREDRESGLGGMAGLAADAAGAATAAGRPGRALELLEQARALLHSELTGVRAPLDALEDRDPGLAEEFRVLRSRTEAAESLLPSATGPGLGPALSDRAAARHRKELADDWTDLLARIRRSHDDFARFLLPPTLGELRAQAAEGPVVTVYAGPLRSEALVLRADRDGPVDVVELPLLSWDMALALVERLRSACARLYDAPDYGGRRRAQRDVSKVLGELWDAVASPVLDACGMSVPPPGGSAPPRLWWCPVGIMSFLPLHVAERYADTGSGPSVLDRAVSSYTPTIGALAYARRAPDDGPRPGSGTLIVGLPDTPGTPALHSAAAECATLERLLPDATTLYGPDATHDTVTAALPRSSTAHFVCHGVSDLHGRGYSRLLLHDHRTRAFTVADVSRLHLPRADLAYLSACATTDTAPRFADEVLHITAAFQTAGYRGVIGSLWKVQGTTGAHIAESVYAHLTTDGTGPPDTTVSAHALHAATTAQRLGHPSSPGLWAPFVHYGR